VHTIRVYILQVVEEKKQLYLKSVFVIQCYPLSYLTAGLKDLFLKKGKKQYAPAIAEIRPGEESVCSYSRYNVVQGE